MENNLETFNFHKKYSHVKFDEILEFFKPAFSSPVTIKAIVDGNINHSDIKWNAMHGHFRVAVIRDDLEIASLIGCQIDHFTGNCGVKAIDHLYFFIHPRVPSKGYNEKCSELLSILESFLYHQTNCGLLIGSDWAQGSGEGPTIMGLKRFGTGYEFTKPTWNPNYTWDPKHTIALFHKDLNAIQTHINYWD